MAARRRRPALAEQMLGLATGYWVSQLVFVAARLGLADELAKGPSRAEDLAKRVGAHPVFLRRALRALASVGVFAEGPGGRFRTTPLARTLESDRAGSLRDFVRMIVEGYNWQAWGELEHGVKSGALPFDHVHGKPLFAWLREHPEQERVFAASMASISASENEAVASAGPFGRLERLVDVGGAHGHLLAAILRRHRKLRGVLYDQPQVVAAAAQSGFVAAPDLQGRCDVVGGSFFDSVPPGADGYVLKYIVHDWDDEKCLRILGHIRAAMAPHARVLVVEHVVRPGNAPDWGKLLDINMLVVPGGQERTRAEFADLFARAGLRLARVVSTRSPLGILEAVAAGPTTRGASASRGAGRGRARRARARTRGRA
jgi:O-methyltransferase domain/Dimerisation domain